MEARSQPAARGWDYHHATLGSVLRPCRCPLAPALAVHQPPSCSMSKSTQPKRPLGFTRVHVRFGMATRPACLLSSAPLCPNIHSHQQLRLLA